MMALEPANLSRFAIVGGLRLSPPGQEGGTAAAPDPQERVPVLVELNAKYPGGLMAVTGMFYRLWGDYASQAGGTWPTEANSLSPAGQPVPEKLAIVAQGLYQCVLSRTAVHDMVEQDRRSAAQASHPMIIFRVWPDYTLYPHIDRSAATVKADAGWRAFDARGQNIRSAVIDSGIDASHEHFSALELYKEARGVPLPDGLTSQLHRDFSYMVNPDDPNASAPAGGTAPAAEVGPGLTDESGHGPHVSGIIAGCSPQGRQLRVAVSQDPDGGYVPRPHVGVLRGMAPACELVSIKVTRRSSWGRWVTSSSAVIKALTYLRTEVNVDTDTLRVHGVNMSLGCGWEH